jgi:hypothetical protein
MGFLKGRMSYMAFRVDGPKMQMFMDEHLQMLADCSAGSLGSIDNDNYQCGWTTGSHALDTEFDGAKNIINDTLHFELRIDTNKLPGDLFRAYYIIELEALAANNPSGFASARQKREAKEIARERLEQESKDGRYRKRKCFPVLWDAKSNEVLFGSTSLTQIVRFMTLWTQTFRTSLIPITAGEPARNLEDQSSELAVPSPFIVGLSESQVAWVVDDSNLDFLGNEFFLWLWFHAENVADTIALRDGSDCTWMITDGIRLECPRGVTGYEVLNHAGPTRMPEAKSAVTTGKLPRQIGITIVRHNEQYTLKWHAETLAVSGAKLPNPPDDVVDARAILETRMDQIRHFRETIRLLYDGFIEMRLSSDWQQVLCRMQNWLKPIERKDAA